MRDLTEVEAVALHAATRSALVAYLEGPAGTALICRVMAETGGTRCAGP